MGQRITIWDQISPVERGTVNKLIGGEWMQKLEKLGTELLTPHEILIVRLLRTLELEFEDEGADEVDYPEPTLVEIGTEGLRPFNHDRFLLWAIWATTLGILAVLIWILCIYYF